MECIMHIIKDYREQVIDHKHVLSFNIAMGVLMILAFAWATI